MTAPGSTDTKGTIRPPAALAGTRLELFAPLYRACAQLHIPPTDVDELELWQVAATLGVDMNDDATADHNRGVVAVTDGPPAPGALSRKRKMRPIGRRRP